MIRLDRNQFKDEDGRTLILRGVNLSGSSKVPSRPDGATYRSEHFFDHRNVSFAGRPFPLEEADEHFTRLREWGLTFLRFLVTWEAVEHAGPGLYDQEYLDYLYAVIKKAGEYGFSLFIDPHEDVWSRFSGGDGAPGWTFEAAGLDIRQFDATGAAMVHQTHGDPFPRMIWSTNNYKLAAATLFTLFFGANDFAPAIKVDGEPIQEFLQGHYIAAMQQVAARLKGLPCVVGYDILNEPAAGYIGVKDLTLPFGQLKMGHAPSPLQGMLLGSGYAQDVEFWVVGLTGLKNTGLRRIDPQGAKAWLPGHPCIWQQAGVWDVDLQGKPQLLKPDYFSRVNGREIDFNRDYLRPFANRYAKSIREVEPEAIIFVESDPAGGLPEWGPEDAPKVVAAPHWYDSYVLITKDFNPYMAVDTASGGLVFRPENIRKSFAAQIASLHREARRMGNAPLLVGEFGIPYDMKAKRAYHTGSYKHQIRAMDRSFRAMEDTLTSCTLWNYTPDNTNLRGDQWNDEDLSIFSRDQQNDPSNIYSGGRALEAVVRPYAIATAGEPLKMSFDLQQREFVYEFRHDSTITAPTLIFVPNYQYPQGYRIELSDGSCEQDIPGQRLTYRCNPAFSEHRIRILPGS